MPSVLQAGLILLVVRIVGSLLRLVVSRGLGAVVAPLSDGALGLGGPSRGGDLWGEQRHGRS